MQFSEKLIFLMNITQTSNKELAVELGVDRSLISLLRSGKRGVPKNVKRMARVFAERSTADFQRYALWRPTWRNGCWRTGTWSGMLRRVCWT